nr:hypothetical protein [Flavobacterium sp. ASV13]
MLNDIVENQVFNAKKELESLSDENQERKDFLIKQTAYYEMELEKFKSEIDKQLSEKFQFSVEELYVMYGQYENKHVSIEFHKFSESAEKFGREISGFIAYGKSERAELETIISAETVSPTNGSIRLECTSCEKMTPEQKTELLTNGFNSGDIYQILTLNVPNTKSYNQIGIKEIPNTITVNIDPRDFDPNRAYVWLYSQKIKNGQPLIDEEWQKFCGISLYLNPVSEQLDLIRKHGFDENGHKRSLVRFHELAAKFHASDITGKELFEFNDLLKARRAERTNEIKLELKRSTNKKLELFAEEYPEIYAELQTSIIEFETESLEYHNLTTPVYWNYQSFLHIYLRHCEELAIEGHFESKTKFQYNLKDIRRILVIALERLRTPIGERLKEGKEFRISGNKSLYFNGNYYSLHILNNGRIAAFHPLENHL